MALDLITIPARRGKAAFVDQAASIKVINTHGSQVVDTFAFVANKITEFMSMEHSRPYFMGLRPRVGDVLVTNKRRPILTLVEDTTPGVHDTLMAACDSYRYGLLGVTGYHDNCTDNLSAAMQALGLWEPGPECEQIDVATLDVVLVPGLGLFGVGHTMKDARIAADIAESTVKTVTDAEAIGRFESAGEANLFDIEYWSLEQAKLGAQSRAPLAGNIVLVTGGGGTIGSAIARAFADEGAEVAVLDVDPDRIGEEAAADQAGRTALAVRCDVTDRDSVRAAFDRV